MGNSRNEPNPETRGLTYFYDFIQLLEKEYAFASVDSIAEEIKFARAVGPVIAGLKKAR
jgi:hypothetical protein